MLVLGKVDAECYLVLGDDKVTGPCLNPAINC
jgi:hypothetical protein